MPTVYITGFGVFNGVADNPSKRIVDKLKDSFQINGHKCEFHVLEVSVGHCQEFLESLDFDSNEYIFIHIGVDSNYPSVKLEQCAYNNMTFRVPDERGLQPQLTCITEGSELDAPLRSALLLPEVCSHVNCTNDKELCGPIDVALSEDPGRFLCNYIYYSTLNLQQTHNRALRSVFIHVPRLDVISEEQQVAQIRNIITEIVKRAE